MYADGAGLWLQIGPSGSKSWIYRYMLDGKARSMGLGALRDLGRAEARERAGSACRKVRLDGIDVVAARQASRAAEKVAAARAITFKDCAAKYVATHRSAWKNAEHGAQWTATNRNNIKDCTILWTAPASPVPRQQF